MKKDMNFIILGVASVIVTTMTIVMVRTILPDIWQLYLLAILQVILVIFVTTRKSRVLYSAAIMLVLFVGAFTAGVFIVDSMVKGIEMVSGPQVGTFMMFEAQNGLVNSRDAFYAIITFVATSMTIYALVLRRRRYDKIK